MTRANTPRIAFIGFGEAGQAIATGLRSEGVERIGKQRQSLPMQGVDGARQRPLRLAGQIVERA